MPPHGVEDTHEPSITRARDALRDAARVVVFTGAGVSAESGVPTFRGAGGLWREFRAEELATPHAFARDPRLVWEWYGWRREVVARCAPNPAHRAIAAYAESLDGAVLDAAFAAARSAEVCLVVGTSALVQPAASVATIAARAGAMVVEVNSEQTPLTASADVSLRGKAGELVPALLGAS